MEEKIIDLCSFYKREKAPSQTKGNLQLPKFIMLCGKYRDKNIVDNRALTDRILQEKRNDVFTIYSEDLFSVFHDDPDMDLLKFEELLAEISDGIILFLESMGSATELGSFSYIDDLARNMLVFINKKYELDESFINDGPIKKINRITKDTENKGGVVFSKFNDNGNIDIDKKNYNRIFNFIKEKQVSLDKHHLKVVSNNRKILIKPQVFLYFILDLIFIFEFIEKDELFSVLTKVLAKPGYEFKFNFGTNNEFQDEKVMEYILNILLKWEIVREIKSKTDNTIFLTMNFSDLFLRENISKSFGKVLVHNQLFNDEEFIKIRLKRKKSIEKIHGYIYGTRFQPLNSKKDVVS